MISFDRSFLRAPRRAGSHVALALALASGAVLAGGVVAAPAYAKKKEEAAPKTNYSKGFVAAYKPVADKVNSDKADLPALKGELETVKAAVETDDDKMAAGQLIYNYGLKTTEIPVQREGMDMMLASGKVAPASLGQYQYVAGQLAYQEKDYPKARELVQAAIASGYTQNDPEAMVAESYFNDNQEAAGLEYLAGVITARDAAGQEVPVTWVKRGLTVAYQGNNGVEARRFSMLLIKHDPTANSWSDAIAIERSFFDYDDQQQLDLLRLARLTDGLRSERDYVDYLSAADARRLPGEVKEVADAGIAAGKLNANDVFVKEAVGIANGRIAADKADLPGLAKDAAAASASATTIQAAGDAFLSYGDFAKAEQFYTAATSKAGLDQNRVLTRLGIAQVGLGKYDEAKATFAKVQGPRAPIAALWSAYASQKADTDTGAM